MKYFKYLNYIPTDYSKLEPLTNGEKIVNDSINRIIKNKDELIHTSLKLLLNRDITIEEIKREKLNLTCIYKDGNETYCCDNIPFIVFYQPVYIKNNDMFNLELNYRILVD